MISIASAINQIGSLANAAREGVTLGTDLATLNAAIKGHVKGTPYSAQAKALANKVWNDDRALQQTLEGLIPGMSAVWPVPPSR